MIIYNGRYNWSGTTQNSSRPITWWPGSYWLTIIDLSKKRAGVHLLKPVIVLISDTGEGYSVRNHFQNLAKSLCRDFNLEISRTLWIEYLPKGSPHLEVAAFQRLTKIGSDTIYTVKWRPIRPNEREELKSCAPESGYAAGDLKF
jgi:hypothetical protein